MARREHNANLRLTLERVSTMYANVNFPTKKSLKEAVKAGEKIGVHQPGPFGGNPPSEGTVCLEGPHYPKSHSWYATATIEGGVITKVK